MTRALETAGAWLLAILWILPLAYAFWTAFHPPEFATRFELSAPLTLQNFVNAWNAAPFARYFVNTVLLVTLTLGAQLVLVTLAAYTFARYEFHGRDVMFALVLVQLMIMPDVLIVENYRTMAALDLTDTITAIGLPYVASAFGIFSCARRSRRSRANSMRPHAWKARVCCACCGRYTFRSPGPCTSPMRWCR